jgi:hypothetical protein
VLPESAASRDCGLLAPVLEKRVSGQWVPERTDRDRARRVAHTQAACALRRSGIASARLLTAGRVPLAACRRALEITRDKIVLDSPGTRVTSSLKCPEAFEFPISSIPVDEIQRLAEAERRRATMR